MDTISSFLLKTGLLLIAIGGMTHARAYAPQSEDVIQDYHHTVWSSELGLGAVFDIQQSEEGYLWLTTSTGVFRFDGVRFQSVSEVTRGAVEDREVHSAFAMHDGRVWFKTRATGLLLWKGGHLTSFPDRRCTPVRREGIAEDQNGSLWLQGTSGLYRLHGSACEQLGRDQGYPGGFPAALLVDRKGTVWVRMPAGELLFLPRGQSHFQSFPYDTGVTSEFLQASSIRGAFLHQAPDGSIWLSDDYGLRRITNSDGQPAEKSMSHVHATVQFGDFTFAPDGALWAATDHGIRLYAPGSYSSENKITTAPYRTFNTQTQDLSSNAVWKALVDREGSIWVGTNAGLDRLRRSSLSAVSFPQTDEHDFAVLADSDNAVWTGSQGTPLTRIIQNTGIQTYQQTQGILCLRRDRAGTVWFAGSSDHRLWQIADSRITSIPFPDDRFGPVFALAFDRNNDLWVSTATGGTYHRTQGAWTNQSSALGKKAGVLGAMADAPDGNVWFGFSNKLVRWDGTTYHKFSFPDGTRGVSETTLFVRGNHVWLAGTGGVELFSEGHFYLMRWRDPGLPDRVSGIVETPEGDLWINGFSGITHVSSAEMSKWLRDPSHAVSADRLNALDGLAGFSAERIPEPSIVESTNGRLWFATTKGIAWLDPASWDRNKNPLPPPVEISSVSADQQTYRVTEGLRLPKHTNDLQIDYTALSLAIPERVRFRYKLDGIDADWQDAGMRRQAFYNSLPPGAYRFHVIACNNDGVWNHSGASLGFSILPAYYQTMWFKIVSLLAAVGFLWWLIRRHIHNVTAQLQTRLAERLAERERIARELHDTLLQSIFGLSLQFQAATDRLKPDDPVRNVLTDALTQSDTVMREGRQRIRDLRSSTAENATLAETFTEYGQQLQAIHSARFHVIVEGESRPLNPLTKQELVIIIREAITNAFQHAKAMIIVVTLMFQVASLRIVVRDDGIGIDPVILKDGGREDHWGLPGMRERALKMNAKLQIRRRSEGGTEIEIEIPSYMAYRGESKRRSLLRRWFLRLRGQERTSLAIEGQGYDSQ